MRRSCPGCNVGIIIRFTSGILHEIREVIAFMNTWQSEMFTERVHIREGAADAVPFALLSDDSNLCSEQLSQMR